MRHLILEMEMILAMNHQVIIIMMTMIHIYMMMTTTIIMEEKSPSGGLKLPEKEERNVIILIMALDLRVSVLINLEDALVFHQKTEMHINAPNANIM